MRHVQGSTQWQTLFLPELEAQFHFERAMFALFALKVDDLKLHLQEWQENDAHSFWSAKKAALMAEIGLLDEAERILEQSLEAIRRKSNLTPTQNDYTLVSQESFVMFLLQAVRHRSLFADRESSKAGKQRREFAGRWHTLRQYKCDPWHELEVFRRKLERPPVTMKRNRKTPMFDIGRVTSTLQIGPGENERLIAYNFLRFCEDSGIPFRIPGLQISTKSGAGALPRIAFFSSHWALATLVRVGDTKAVDEIFDRSSLVRMNLQSIDSLIDRYLEALRRATSDIESRTHRRAGNLGTLLARILPEILSRLCCKCSYGAKEKIIKFLLEVYQSEHRMKYDGIKHLTERLMEAFLVHELLEMVPILLCFPIRRQLAPVEEREFVNPFHFVRIPKGVAIACTMVDQKVLDELFDKASSGYAASRRWAVTILGKLHDLGMLENVQLAKFGDVLWSKTGEDNMPADTDYHRFAFLKLPHPAEVDPVQAFMKYIRRAQFPDLQTKVVIGARDVPFFTDILESKSVPWKTEDVRAIVHRLIEWWDKHRNHLKTAIALEESEVTGGLLYSADQSRRRVRQFVRTLSIVVVRRWAAIDGEDTRDALQRVVTEMSEDKIPTVALKIACASLFPEWRERAINEIECQDASTPYETVVDALTAAHLESHRSDHDGKLAGSDHSDLKRLLYVVSGSMRWRHGKSLAVTIQTMGDLVKRHPWGFVDDIERNVLLRLRGLIRDTALQSSGAMRLDSGESRKKVAEKLFIRRESAALAYRLFELYRKRRRVPIPEPILEWEKACRAEEEFAEIRRQWISSASLGPAIY